MGKNKNIDPEKVRKAVEEVVKVGERNTISLYLGSDKIAEIEDASETSLPMTYESPNWNDRIRQNIERQLREQFEAQLPLMIDDIEKQVKNGKE